MKVLLNAILLAGPILVLAGSAEKISCFVGDQDGVKSTEGFDFCHTTFYVKHDDKGFYGGYLYEDKAIYEDKMPSNNGQCYMRGEEHKDISIECFCYKANCNEHKTLHEFMKGVLAL